MYVGSDETDLEIIGGGQNRNNNRIMYDIVDMNTIVLFACQKTNTGQIMICVHEIMWLYAQLHCYERHWSVLCTITNCDYEVLLHLNKTLFAYKMIELGYISAVEGEDTEHVQTFSFNI